MNASKVRKIESININNRVHFFFLINYTETYHIEEVKSNYMYFEKIFVYSGCVLRSSHGH